MIVQSRDAQYRHSVKKKETELVKLKDRLHNLLIDRSEQKIGNALLHSYFILKSCMIPNNC